MRPVRVLGEPEASYVRRFFESVDRNLTDEMQAGRALREENLTFLLGRLLDGESTFQRMLDYPLDKLNGDLAECGTGTEVSVELVTNEHTTTFESSVSHADLGLVVRRENSVFGPAQTKAVIVQSKRLIAPKDKYSIRSAYSSFNPVQYKELKKLASNHDWSGVAYFLYNPTIGAFDSESQQIVRAVESNLFSFGGTITDFRRWHPKELHFLAREFGFPFWPKTERTPLDDTSANELRAERTGWVDNRPGLRVLGVRCLAGLVESGDKVRGSFSLADCYKYAMSSSWVGNSGSVPFLPLSVYIVDMLLGCTRGSSNSKIVRIAEGNNPEPEPEENEDEGGGVAVRHTLTITLRSTLPEIDIDLGAQQ